jgi:serine phosphatase RsbU (regulator of sigma subunit)
MRFRFLYTLLFSLLSCNFYPQQKLIDSLRRAVPVTHDTSRANGLIRLSRELLKNNPQEAKKYLDEALSISKEFTYLKGEAMSQMGYSLIAYYAGDLKIAEKKLLETLSMATELGDQRLQARCFVNLGLVYDGQSNYEKSITWYFKGLEVWEKLHDEHSAALVLNNIGTVYDAEEKSVMALTYHRRALERMTHFGDKWGIASALTNIGVSYKRLGKIDSSLIYYHRAIKLREELDDTKGLTLIINNIGSIYLDGGKYADALNCFQRVIALSRLNGDLYTTGLALNNLSVCSYYKKDYRRSLALLDSATALGAKLGSKDLMMQAYQRYCRVYKAMKNYNNALDYDLRYAAMRDSIYNEKNEKAVFEMQSSYESEKKEREIALLTKDSELQALSLKRNRIWVMSLTSGIFLFFLLTGLVFSRGRVKKKANQELEEQNNRILRQKLEITDSIQYALNIQRTMLPKEDQVKALLPDHFIFHQPKDIVSGDFYLVEKAKNRILFSVADCTGHGVPGALLSFLGMDILHEAIHRKGMIHPADILQELDFEINHRLRQREGMQNVKDGMDIAMCALDMETLELEVAGAFNPVYIISKGELLEIKPDKHAIGSYDGEKKYTYNNRSFQMHKGDQIYLFSDGYADQFGGPLGKKFKYKSLKELLLQNHQRPMEEQGVILAGKHVAWKGSLFQVDDILVMGIRI